VRGKDGFGVEESDKDGVIGKDPSPRARGSKNVAQEVCKKNYSSGSQDWYISVNYTGMRDASERHGWKDKKGSGNWGSGHSGSSSQRGGHGVSRQKVTFSLMGAQPGVLTGREELATKSSQSI